MLPRPPRSPLFPHPTRFRPLGRRGGGLHVHQRDREPHHRRELQPHLVHDRRLGGRRRAHQPERQRRGRLRREPGVHHHAGRVPHHRGRARRRRLGGRGGELHVQQRDDEPHDRRELRAHELHDRGLGGRRRGPYPPRQPPPPSQPEPHPHRHHPRPPPAPPP